MPRNWRVSWGDRVCVLSLTQGMTGTPFDVGGARVIDSGIAAGAIRVRVLAPFCLIGADQLTAASRCRASA